MIRDALTTELPRPPVKDNELIILNCPATFFTSVLFLSPGREPAREHRREDRGEARKVPGIERGLLHPGHQAHRDRLDDVIGYLERDQ